MSKRKSWVGNFSIESLFALLRQSEKELINLKKIEKETIMLKKRIKEVEYTIYVLKFFLVRKHLAANISLQEIAKKDINSYGLTKDVYDTIFTIKALEEKEPIEVSLLESVIDSLDIEHICMIMNSQNDNIYRKFANERFEKLIFDVEDDVYDEFVLKKRMDEGRD